MIASLAEPGSSLVILRREHKELLDRLAPEVPTRVRCCAAQLINYFEHWRQWKREHYPTEWIYQPLVKIRYDLMNAFSIHVIRSSINMLQELGFLSVRKNDRDQNRRNGQDKTHQYLIHSDRIKAALKNPSSQSVAETLEESLFVEVKTSCVIDSCNRFLLSQTGARRNRFCSRGRGPLATSSQRSQPRINRFMRKGGRSAIARTRL